MRSTARLAPRLRPNYPDGPGRGGELRAGLAALAIAAEFVLVPFVLIPAAVLILLGRISRWRPHWLLVPLLGALSWLAVASPPFADGVLAATRAIAAQSGRLARLAAAVAARPGRLLHAGPDLHAVLAGNGRWLPAYLVAATAEAALALWLGWRRSPPAWRPGLVAMQRNRAAVGALRAGHTVMADGCALGVDVPAGRLAGVSWAAAQRGVLVAGHDEQQLASPVLAAVCAAVRRRKTVLMLDLAQSDLVSQAAGVAASLGVPVAEIALPDGELSAGGLEGIIGRAIRRREAVAIRALHDAQPVADVPAQATAQAAVRALTSVLAGLRDLGLRGDCLVWIAGCEAVDDGTLRALLALAPATGIAVLLTSSADFARLAEAAELVIVADAVPGRFAIYRTGGQGVKIIQTVPLRAAIRFP
jgi:hypothetical protein